MKSLEFANLFTIYFLYKWHKHMKKINGMCIWIYVFWIFNFWPIIVNPFQCSISNFLFLKFIFVLVMLGDQ